MAPRRRQATLVVLGGGAALNLLIGAMLALFLLQSHQQTMQHARVTAQNLSTVLKENISGTLRALDASLGSTADDLLQLPPGAAAGLLAQLRERQPALGELRVFDAAGRLQRGAALPPDAAGAIAGQAWFQALRGPAGPGLSISPPRLDAASARWHVLLARAMRDAGGRFHGVLTAEVDLARLSSAFSLVSVGAKGAMTLSSSDEQVFARYARLHYDDAMIGKTIASAKLRAYVASGRRPETYLFTSPLDGAERLISLQRIFDRPLLAAPANLYFSVGLASDDYLQKWREEARAAALIMLLSLLVSGAAAWSLLRFWHERDARQIQSRAFEREHAVNEERLRIMRDLHDGVGSQLLSALMMVQGGNASREQTVLLLQECMDDMRLAIDTLAPDEPDLLPVLGNFRFRMEARYRAVGLDFLWINHALPDALTLAPHAGLQLLRVLQEALANVLRHAQARRVKVEVYFSPRRLRVRIEDDGVGMAAAPTLAGSGHGMANMRLRAHKLGATLAWLDAGGEAPRPGTVVELVVPLNEASQKGENPRADPRVRP
ncbi:ATP-binding protein [Rugamonas rubra]|uniref:histidine kinase n=1 Tax=Rugamonas rubra TaxID=758825 RepID=A0A1I4IVR3_9BURK|nr:cache domain-containing protein [Rugamonas rubra]SFL58073.1 Signal transduction histidine kinase [Rugamonas rubra]